MASKPLKALSAVLEKKIQRLYLDEFPCRTGSWKPKTKEEQLDELQERLYLLNDPKSPWATKATWSPQAADLRRHAAITPGRLSDDFIHSFFTTLRIVDERVSLIDDGLLKFSKLGELVLCANYISEVPAENLPSSLRVLELYANQLSALARLTSCPPPHLHYLGLALNPLGSHEDLPHLTGTHWPELVVLDLADCEFQEQMVLLEALSTLPRLKSLFLQGNPFTLATCYPGLTVDRLPGLCYLDGSRITLKEKFLFRGLAESRAVAADQALATVKVGRVMGIPNPLTGVDKNTSEFGYFITYEFIGHQTPVNLKYVRKFHSDAAPESDCSSDADLQSHRNSAKETCAFRVFTEEVEVMPRCHTTHVSTHHTAKMPWSECVDFSDTQTYTVTDLGALKKFLKQGLTVRVEEEKPSVKSASNKDKSKDKNQKPVPEPVQDPPVRTTLSSVHVSLESLRKSGQKVEVVLRALHTEAEAEAELEKDQERKIQESKPGSKADVPTGDSSSVQPETITVELSVELQTWSSLSEAQHAPETPPTLPTDSAHTPQRPRPPRSTVKCPAKQRAV